jgi:hypothetical protein
MGLSMAAPAKVSMHEFPATCLFEHYTELTEFVAMGKEQVCGTSATDGPNKKKLFH